MMPDRWARVKALFTAALERAPHARSAYLAEACGDDTALRQEVEALLMADGEAASIETGAALGTPVRSASQHDVTAATPLHPGTRLGAYEILGPLGAGGMGVVYRARDTRLQRLAAIKLIADEEDVASRARLLREAQHASALNHPNICTIYDVGESGGKAFIAMEYIEGRRLSELIPSSGLEIEAVLRYGSQIADALTHAHDRDIVHRDLKSANIVITPEGRAKVLDFGLAKRMPGREIAGAPPAESLTAAGTVAGTVSYMAPETLRGEPADARADVWALGVVLFEMSSGHLPFSGQHGFEVMAAILHQPASPLPAALPLGLRAIVQRCLSKDPTQRYQRAGEVRAALDLMRQEREGVAEAAVTRPRLRAWVRAGTIVLLLLLAAAVLSLDSWRDRLPFGLGRHRIASLAVLPLENLSRDPEQEYFADGLTEALITDLAQISALRVTSRTSVMRYKGTNKPVPQIARELQVDAVVGGSILHAGDRVRITAHLIHGADDRHLWADSYERDLRDILSLQNQVAQAIADQIKVTLTPAEHARLASSRTVDPEAYQLYLRGRYLWNQRTERTINDAIRYFEAALRKDPNYASAYSGLADSYSSLGDSNDVGSLQPNLAIPKAKAAATRALELDDTRAEAHNSLGFINLLYDWDWHSAETEFKRALELNPRSADAHHWYSHLLMALGKPEEAQAESQRALDLDALNPIINTHLGWAYVFARQYDKAIEQLTRTLELFPDFGLAHWYLALAYEQKAAYAQALPEFRRAQTGVTGNVVVLADLGHAYAVSGNAADARQILEQLTALSSRRYVPSTSVALIYAGLGDYDRAFEWLDKAVAERAEWLIYLKVDPRLDPLRRDSRFRQLERRVGLP
jgi:serine/threonine-protein kinase